MSESSLQPLPPVEDLSAHHSHRPESQPLSDGSLPLYKLQQLLPDSRYGDRAINEFRSRVTVHNELLERQYDTSMHVDGIVAEEFTDEPVEIDVHAPRLTDEQITAFGFPKASAGVEPIAIVENGVIGEKTVSLLCLGEGTTTFIRKQLQDPKSMQSDASVDPQWVDGGMSFRNGKIPDIELEAKKGAIKISVVDNDMLENARILRAKPTSAERIANTQKDYEKIAKKNRRRTIGAGALTLASGLTGLFTDTDAQPSIPNRTYEQLESLDSDAVASTEAAIEAFESGDVSKLAGMVEKTKFSEAGVSADEFESVASADSYEELESSMDVALSKFGLDISFPETDSAQYTGLNEGLYDDTEQLSLGVLDFAHDYGALMKDRPDMPHLKIVDEIVATDGISAGPGGLYIHRNGSDRPTILLSVGTVNDGEGFIDLRPNTRESATSIFGHEYAHDMHLSADSSIIDSSSVTRVNPQGYEYRESSYGEKGYSNLNVGNDVADDHALDNDREDVAETFQHLIGKDTVGDLFSSDTVLDEKSTAVLADIEKEFPGISAQVLRQQLESRNQVSHYEKVDRKLAQGVNSLRNNTSKLLLSFALMTAGFSAASIAAKRREEIRNKFYE